MSTSVEMEQAVAVISQTTFRRVVRTMMVIKCWMRHMREQRKQQVKNVDLDNVRRVFEPAMHVDKVKESKPLHKRILGWSMDETSTVFYLWTAVVFIGCWYNLITIVVMVFEEVQRSFYQSWITFNIVFDCVFLCDLVLLTRRQFVEDGVRVDGVKEMFMHRIKSKYFYLDILCILPTDLLLYLKPDFSLSRLNRLLKCYRVSEFNALTEIRTSFPNLFRITKLIFTCFIIFHWNGCLYFFISVLYNFPSATIENWIFSYDKIPDPIFISCGVDHDFNMTESDCSTDIIPPLRIYEDYDNMTEEVDLAMMYWANRSQAISFTKFVKQYALSFYWSALTLVTLGEQPSPNNTFQNTFEICDTLLGLVLFAVIVGDVGNMVTTMNMKRSNFEEVLDGCKSYMMYRKVHRYLQRKTVDYFSYTWSHGGGQMDEEEIAEFLPTRLYGQLAVHIHMETLRRVKLFEECEPNLLYELILKLELRVYSPMDYVCKKGDVGTEMYIVKEGSVEVVSEDGTKVFVQLGEGTVFGELSILNIPGNKNGNRRTANVRSVGYSDLYVLSKDDLWAALREYPDAKHSLMEKGKSILAKDNLLEEVTDEQELEQDAPVEEQLEAAAKIIREIEAQLDLAEKNFRESTARTKRNLYKLEREVDEEMKWMLNGPEPSSRKRRASYR
ncbi:cyclic nucleotide-binding domain protein [Ancylostoma caninum]|uniref:Cyclic nucleotide-binding domain protein n=1 Tax=Ancylostoma caninum TaxID=29170 RepID=A0A368GIS3_ANCCA|nr:cyclic nucleotide-binding domain protein [Ancylostoma caninum]